VAGQHVRKSVGCVNTKLFENLDLIGHPPFLRIALIADHR
jgi:hypothetical protein